MFVRSSILAAYGLLMSQPDAEQEPAPSLESSSARSGDWGQPPPPDFAPNEGALTGGVLLTGLGTALAVTMLSLRARANWPQDSSDSSDSGSSSEAGSSGSSPGGHPGIPIAGLLGNAGAAIGSAGSFFWFSAGAQAPRRRENRRGALLTLGLGGASIVGGLSMLALRRGCWGPDVDYRSPYPGDGDLGCSARYDLAAATLYGVGIPTLAFGSFWLGATRERMQVQISLLPRVRVPYAGLELSGRF